MNVSIRSLREKYGPSSRAENTPTKFQCNPRSQFRPLNSEQVSVAGGDYTGMMVVRKMSVEIGDRLLENNYFPPAAGNHDNIIQDALCNLQGHYHQQNTHIVQYRSWTSLAKKSNPLLVKWNIYCCPIGLRWRISRSHTGIGNAGYKIRSWWAQTIPVVLSHYLHISHSPRHIDTDSKPLTARAHFNETR